MMAAIRFKEVPGGIPVVWCPACEKIHGHRAKKNRMVPGHGSWSGEPLFRCPNDEQHPAVYEVNLLSR